MSSPFRQTQSMFLNQRNMSVGRLNEPKPVMQNYFNPDSNQNYNQFSQTHQPPEEKKPQLLRNAIQKNLESQSHYNSTQNLLGSSAPRRAGGTNSMYGSRRNLRKVDSVRSVSSSGFHSNKSTKDFNQAYIKLVGKMYNEQGATGLVTDDEVRRLEYYNRLNLEEF